jgi:molybdate transport system regulatory protein
MSTRVTLRLDFKPDSRLGPGKVALLEAIERCGSISAAGREFGMSYRRAWVLVDELNHMFTKPLVDARLGGRNGGGAMLTKTGKAVVTFYRDAERKLHKTARNEIKGIEAALAD